MDQRKLFVYRDLLLWNPACICWGYMSIMEKKMETIRMGYIGYILGLYWGYIPVIIIVSMLLSFQVRSCTADRRGEGFWFR